MSGTQLPRDCIFGNAKKDDFGRLVAGLPHNANRTVAEGYLVANLFFNLRFIIIIASIISNIPNHCIAVTRSCKNI